MSKAKVKKELNKFTKEQIIELVLEMYDKKALTNEYLDFFVTLDEDKLIAKYKKEIKKYVKGYRLQFDSRSAKKVMKEFLKYEVSDEGRAEVIMLLLREVNDLPMDIRDFTQAEVNFLYDMIDYATAIAGGLEDEEMEKEIINLFFHEYIYL